MTTRQQHPSNSLRFKIFELDNFTCQYCGRAAPEIKLQIDHIIPFSENGGNEITNLITSCHQCNIGKGRNNFNFSKLLEKRLLLINEHKEKIEKQKLEAKKQKRLKLFEERDVINKELTESVIENPKRKPIRISLAMIRLQKYTDDKKKKKITQSDLAKAIGCSRSYFTQLISGKRTRPSIDMAIRIEEITGIKFKDWGVEYEKITD